jgi:hypothetical protein
VTKGDIIANENTENFLGTAGCILSSATNPGQSYLLTCNHVMTGNNFDSPGALGGNAVKFISGDASTIGTWQTGLMDNTMDAAIISLDPLEQNNPNNINQPIYSVSESDRSVTLIELTGAISGLRQAFIIDIGQPIDVDYDNATIQMSNMITLSADINPNNYTPVTLKGDSGALVYHATTLQPIAMVIGANQQFTFALPITDVLNSFPELNLSINP